MEDGTRGGAGFEVVAALLTVLESRNPGLGEEVQSMLGSRKKFRVVDDIDFALVNWDTIIDPKAIDWRSPGTHPSGVRQAEDGRRPPQGGDPKA